MLEEGFEYGDAGVRAFTEIYGLLEKITVIEPADNACSEARVTTRVRHRPGASPLLFGRFLMSLGAFVSLEDISDALPPYREEIVSVEMDEPLQKAYEEMEEDLGGYADELYNILFRLEARKMLEEGFEHGAAGGRTFTETYGLIEKVTVIEPADNRCSEARVTKRVRQRPGSLTPAVWPLPDEPGCVRFAGRYFRCSPALPGGNRQRGDGPAFAEGL